MQKTPQKAGFSKVISTMCCGFCLCVKVTPDQQLYVPLLTSEVGSKVEFEDVMLYSDDAGVVVGTPSIDSAKVTATVLEHMKDDKVIVFKKKKRKGYRKLNGHRQQFTRIEIEQIEK